jgi:transcriptional regulator with XRE-family HTH domain
MVNGTLIRRAREAAGLSRAKLAKRLGIAEHTIYRWEHGMHSRLSFDTVMGLAGALDVPVESLLEPAARNGSGSPDAAPETHPVPAPAAVGSTQEASDDDPSEG